MKILKAVLGMRATLVALLFVGITALAAGKKSNIKVDSDEVEITAEKPKVRPLPSTPPIPGSKKTMSKVERREILVNAAMETARGVNRESNQGDAGRVAVTPSIFFSTGATSEADSAVVMYVDGSNTNPTVVLVYFFSDEQWEILDVLK